MFRGARSASCMAFLSSAREPIGRKVFLLPCLVALGLGHAGILRPGQEACFLAIVRTFFEAGPDQWRHWTSSMKLLLWQHSVTRAGSAEGAFSRVAERLKSSTVMFSPTQLAKARAETWAQISAGRGREEGKKQHATLLMMHMMLAVSPRSCATAADGCAETLPASGNGRADTVATHA